MIRPSTVHYRGAGGPPAAGEPPAPRGGSARSRFVYIFDELWRGAGMCCLPLPLLVIIVLAVILFRQLARLQQQFNAFQAENQDLRERIERIERGQPAAPAVAAEA